MLRQSHGSLGLTNRISDDTKSAAGSHGGNRCFINPNNVRKETTTMKKTLTIFTLIFALLLTAGCAASNLAQDEQIAVMAAAGDAAGEPAPITMDEAHSIALNHAGVSAADAIILKTEYDREENHYEVEFRFADYEYDYEIHATAGHVLSASKEYEAPPETRATEQAAEKATEKPTEKASEKPTEKPAQKSATAIGKDKAKAIALDHAGVSASKATNVKVEYDKEDGKYDVDFRYNNYEYDYEIHHTSGKVISHEKEYDAPAETKPASTKATEKATEKPTEKSSSAIGKEKAKAIALDHAGVSASKATNVKVEYDKEDGKYDVDFRYNNYEYDYEIHHTSGKVISHEKEYDAPPEKATEKATESSKIGKEKAKSIALKHAGLSASDVRELQVEYDKDDGVPIYDVEFEHGKREYSYEIHAETGKILSHEIDD